MIKELNQMDSNPISIKSNNKHKKKKKNGDIQIINIKMITSSYYISLIVKPESAKQSNWSIFGLII